MSYTEAKTVSGSEFHIFYRLIYYKMHTTFLPQWCSSCNFLINYKRGRQNLSLNNGSQCWSKYFCDLICFDTIYEKPLRWILICKNKYIRTLPFHILIFLKFEEKILSKVTIHNKFAKYLRSWALSDTKSVILAWSVIPQWIVLPLLLSVSALGMLAQL